MTTPIAPAGGRATEGGMAFQAGVAAWFAAYAVSRMPLGARFGLDRDAIAVRLRLETGEGLDDIEVSLADGGAIVVQCKADLSLSAKLDSDLAKTLHQLVGFVRNASVPSSGIDLSRSAAVLAVERRASGTLDDLEQACRMFDLGGVWAEVYAQLSQPKRHALDIFREHTSRAWSALSGSAPSDAELVSLARIFHVIRFDVDSGATDWREASGLLGRRLFGTDEAGVAPFGSLLAIARELIKSGAPAEVNALLSALRKRGHLDTHAPGFDSAVAALRARTRNELDRLARHCLIPIGDPGLPIVRECLPALTAAAEGGSLLVVGEPGAGKTGVLVALAEARLAAALPTVFLSVDQFTGVPTFAALQAELGSSHSVIDVLNAWPGGQRGFVVIDALDASRGGPAEAIFARLIQDVLLRANERWTVVASVRTFDLVNGRRFRALMPGNPPSENYRERALSGVRHFLVPRLTDAELTKVAAGSSLLRQLRETAPDSVRELIRNIFNLSLAAELIHGEVSAASIASVATQADLIGRYEDVRLPTQRLRQAVKAAVSLMIDRRRLVVRSIDIVHEALDDAMQTGVLVPSGDRVSFAHHVLFDHAAGRFYLEWENAALLKSQLGADAVGGLLMGPAVRFAIELMWRDDSAGRPVCWRFVAELLAMQTLDPIVSSVVLRTVSESVSGLEDVEALCELIRASSEGDGLGMLLGRMSRLLSVGMESLGLVDDEVAKAWLHVAHVAACTRQRQFASGAQFLVFTFSTKADLTQTGVNVAFGLAARELLRFAFALEPALQGVTSAAIRYVTKSYASDPAASRLLLNEILLEPRFTQNAHEELPWLAEGIRTIAPSDPNFAIQIYTTAFGRDAPSHGESWLGGQASQILPLRTSKEQDYSQSRWHLEQALPVFLDADPVNGTRAVSSSAIGLAGELRRPSAPRSELTISLSGHTIVMVEDHLTMHEWRVDADMRGMTGGEVLGAFVAFLRRCDPSVFRMVVQAASADSMTVSIWARFFGIATERPGVADDLLWPIATSPETLAQSGAARDAMSYIASVYAVRTTSERVAFENSLLARIASDEAGVSGTWRWIAARLLSIVEEGDLVSEGVRALKAELNEDGLLMGNGPMISSATHWVAAQDFTDDLLRHRGVNVDVGPDKELRDATRPLESALRPVADGTAPVTAGELWLAIAHVVETIDRLGDTPSSHTLRDSWGSVAAAVSRFVQYDSWPSTDGSEPDLGQVVALLDRLSLSPYPEPNEEQSDGMSARDSDVRVFAASSVMTLAHRFGDAHCGLLQRVRNVLSDPAAAVRVKVARWANGLWEVARDTMWELFESIASDEPDARVVTFFVSDALNRLTWKAPERCVVLLQRIIDRFPVRMHEQGKRDDFARAVAVVGVQLWVFQGEAGAERWMLEWTAAPELHQSHLTQIMLMLRGALVGRFAPNAEVSAAAVQDRAREVLRAIVCESNRAMERALAVLNDSAALPEARTSAQALGQCAARLLDGAVNQLYFGSGAFKTQDGQDAGVLMNNSDKLAFLTEYRDVLDAMEEAPHAAAAYHLVELYEHLAVASPEVVFDRIAHLVTGTAAKAGYHYETLALGTLVRLVRTYLADHRSIFDEPKRQERLVEMLELFSSAGWPEALKLLYELPDLLR